MSAFRSLKVDKQTWRGQAKNVANDPTRTSANLSCCSSEDNFSPYQNTRLRRTILPAEREADIERRKFLGLVGGVTAQPW